jgi:hypothetical protein
MLLGYVLARSTQSSQTVEGSVGFENFDQLVMDMRRINEKKKISFSTRTNEQLKEFAEGEGAC